MLPWPLFVLEQLQEVLQPRVVLTRVTLRTALFWTLLGVMTVTQGTLPGPLAVAISSSSSTTSSASSTMEASNHGKGDILVGLMLMLRIIQRETAYANAQLLEAELSQSLEKTALTSSSSKATGTTQVDAFGESSATPTPSLARAAGNSTGEKPTQHHFRRLIKFVHGHSVALRRILKAQNKSLAWMYAFHTLVGEYNLAVAPVHDKS